MKTFKHFYENGILYIEYECPYCRTVNIFKFIGGGEYKCMKCHNPFWLRRKK